MPNFQCGFRLSSTHMPEESVDLVPTQPGLIIAISNFFTAEECELLIQLADAQVQRHPKLT